MRLLRPLLSTQNCFCEEKSPLSSLHPISPIRVFSPHPDIEIAFDVRRRTPLYVLERVRARSRDRDARRRHFYEETSLPVYYRSRNQYFKDSGLDRGHMAAAANHPDNSKPTYNLMNVAPQDPLVNRKVWNRLEGWVRRVAESYENMYVYVITGPLWLPARVKDDGKWRYEYDGIGVAPTIISVPTHYFKVVVVLNEDTIEHYACFVVANDGGDADKALKDCVVPWKALEAVSGLELFPTLSKPKLSSSSSSLALTTETTLDKYHLCVRLSCS